MSFSEWIVDRARRGQFRADRLVRDSVRQVRARVHHNGVKAYWAIGRANFGDLITPQLLLYLDLTPNWTHQNKARVFSCGSILSQVPKGFDGVVLGSGMLRASQAPDLSAADVRALRGPLSVEACGQPDDLPVGDPGLLAPWLLRSRPRKRYALGIVPHYVDWDHEVLHRIKSRLGDQILIVDVRRHPSAVFKDLASCEAVLSTSLHGVICSDALGVPTAWVRLTDKVVGEGFKFHDYGASVGRELTQVDLDGGASVTALKSICERPPEDRLYRTQRSIGQVFLTFAEQYSRIR